MAMTANGLIAAEDGDSSWTSEADEKSFAALRKKIGNVIMGRGTYDTLVGDSQFPFPDCLNVVMTREAPETETLKKVVFTDKSPEEVLQDLAAQGFSEALLAGGGDLNGSFMTDGLVDEIYLTVEPLAIGQGIKLFGTGDFRRDLELLEVNKLSDNEVQLHYGVKRATLDNYLESD